MWIDLESFLKRCLRTKQEIGTAKAEHDHDGYRQERAEYKATGTKVAMRSQVKRN